MSSFEEDPLYRDPDLAQFYDLAQAPRADFAYCAGLLSEGASLLDLGCGTGRFVISVVGNREITAVDPAGAMLDVGRQKAGGDKIIWVEADARDVRLDARFDLIVLSGHTYQVFLTDEDQRAVLATIATHLNPEGRFIFDSRNPAFDAPKERQRTDNPRELDHPELGKIAAWNQSAYDTAAGILTYENGYRVIETGAEHSAVAKIRYTPRKKIVQMIGEAGLVVDEWLGDWQGAPFEARSREIIPIGRLG